MKTHLILSEDWQEIKDAIKEAEQYLSVFNVKITSEIKNVDVSSDFLYDNALSQSQLKIQQTKSLKAAYIFGLAHIDKATSSECIGLICDKSKALEDIGLYGQQQTLGIKQIIEVYAVKKKKGVYGFSNYNSYCLVHELFHALADFYGVEDTLHEYVHKNKKSLDNYRSSFVGLILKNELGLLPLVNKKAKQLVEYAASIHLPIRIVEGYRSPERQDQLFSQTPKVTNAKAWESMHQYRVAFDIVFVKEGYSATNVQWNVIASYAKTLGLDWGGDWASFKDRPHFELTFGKSLSDFQHNNINWQQYMVTEEPLFIRDLKRGDIGEDVKELQKMLNKLGFIVAKAGHGSIGKETEYFGELTRKALSAYQENRKILPSDGYFGPITRKRLLSEL